MGPSVLGGVWVGLGVCLPGYGSAGRACSLVPASEWSVGGSQWLEKRRKER